VKQESKAEWLAREIQSQRTWIHQHGGDLSGYVARYGSKDGEHFGDGGEAIFAADTAALVRWEAMLEAVLGDKKQMRKQESKKIDETNYREVAQQAIRKYEEKNMAIDAIVWSTIIGFYETALKAKTP
jgi:hypothetical protein